MSYLDDISTSNAIQRWLFTANERQNWLIKIILMGFAVYLACSVVLVYAVWMRLVQAQEAYLLIAGMMGAISMMYLAVRMGWNLRLRDPDLTLPQMLSALTWCAYAYGMVNEAHGGVLMLLTLVFMFGVFNMSQRHTLIGTVYAVLTMGSVMLYKALTNPAVYNPYIQIAFFVLTSIVIFTIAAFSFTLSAIRLRIEERKAELADAMQRFQASGEVPPRAGSEFSQVQDRLWLQFAELAQQRRELDEHRKMMLAAISHDLRSPLGRIRMAAELLPQSLDVEVRRESIARNVDVANRLLTDFIDMARVDHEPIDGRVDLRALVLDVIQEMPELRVLELPDQPQWLVPASAVALERVLRNLIDNANVYGTSPFEMGLRCDANTTLLWLRDHGIGIDPEQYEYFLQPFTRAETNRLRPGTGLGLAIVQRTMARHGGRVALINANPGLRVELHFPRCEAD